MTDAAVTDAAAAPRGTHRSPIALPVFALVLGSLVAFLPSSQRPALTLSTAIAALGTAIGLPLLVSSARRADVTAGLGSAFALWCVVAAAASRAPLAWTGEYITGTGALFCLAIAGYWAIGRSLPAGAIPAVAAGFLAGTAVNAVVAVLQGVVDLSAMEIHLFDDRSTGLLGNPVFLGACCAAAVALLPILRRTWIGMLSMAVLLATATQMSGSRNSIVVLIAAGTWSAFRVGRRRGLALLLALALGLAGGSVLHENAETTAGARLQSTSGVGPRLDNWGAGVRAALDRPVAGYGPGRWRAATSPRRGLALARKDPDKVYADAHNLPIEYLATTGFVGAAFLLAWLGSIALGLRRAAQPELAVAALALLAFHAVEPQHVTITPLMLLLAGAAAVRRQAPAAPRRAMTAVQAVLVVVALALGARLVAGDLLYRSGELDFDLARTQRASGLLWPWPNPVSTEGRIHAYQARTRKDPDEMLKALDAVLRARRLEPLSPARSIAVATTLGQVGRHAAAAREFAHALELNPWSRDALVGRAGQLTILGRTAQARACRTATELHEHADRTLHAARRACLAP